MISGSNLVELLPDIVLVFSPILVPGIALAGKAQLNGEAPRISHVLAGFKPCFWPLLCLSILAAALSSVPKLMFIAHQLEMIQISEANVERLVFVLDLVFIVPVTFIFFLAPLGKL